MNLSFVDFESKLWTLGTVNVCEPQRALLSQVTILPAYTAEPIFNRSSFVNALSDIADVVQWPFGPFHESDSCLSQSAWVCNQLLNANEAIAFSVDVKMRVR